MESTASTSRAGLHTLRARTLSISSAHFRQTCAEPSCGAPNGLLQEVEIVVSSVGNFSVFRCRLTLEEVQAARSTCKVAGGLYEGLQRVKASSCTCGKARCSVLAALPRSSVLRVLGVDEPFCNGIQSLEAF